MPRYVKRTKKRTYRRKPIARRAGKTRARSTRIVTSNPRGQGLLFPDAFRAKLKYSVLLEFGGVTDTYFSFRGNGPYDPETAVGGGQPLGWAQFATMYYLNYTRGSSCSVRVVQGATPTATQVTLYPTKESGVVSTDAAQPGAQTRVIGGDASSKVFLKSYTNCDKQFGRRTLGDNDFMAGSSSLPAQQWYWHVRANSLDGASNVDTFIVASLVYYITFSNRIKIIA